MFRELIPRLSTRYRVVAPDLPGFGFTTVPAARKYEYSFVRFPGHYGASFCERSWPQALATSRK
jgi:pimeloyl-ACP methyl ester carboxylesterase